MLVELGIHIKDKSLVFLKDTKAFTHDFSLAKNIAFFVKKDTGTLMATVEKEEDGTQQTFSVEALKEHKLGIPEGETRRAEAWSRLTEYVTRNLNDLSYPQVSTSCVVILNPSPDQGPSREIRFQNKQNPDIHYTLSVPFKEKPPDPAAYYNQIEQCFKDIQAEKIPNFNPAQESSPAVS